ncbi:hypothetical protein AB1Y20_021084 [Prymnesium parvum]|uniref:Tyrosine specific protein phosphatases domain-containing protein n=1 Tax=Prymnesium parvum TaxID=97485 RepID=A0AB34JIM1_PRYPA
MLSSLATPFTTRRPPPLASLLPLLPLLPLAAALTLRPLRRRAPVLSAALAAALSSDASLRLPLAIASRLVPLAGPGLKGLSAVLLKLAAVTHWPDDVTEWLCARLRATRQPHVCAYTERVLCDGMVLKCDEFDGIHMLRAPRPHPHVWNLRRTDAPLPIFGAGQCHLEGLLHVARHLKEMGFERVLWFNMREEPVVFLNGYACAPRVASALNENVDFLLAIEGHELDGIERRLRDDCLEEDMEEGGLSIYFEEEMKNVLKPWPLHGHALSVREAYEWLNKQPRVPAVQYVRIPIADEAAPEEKDFDQLVSEIGAVALACAAPAGGSPSCALLFNCHMGRGRTTTGMVCGSILMEAARGWTPQGADASYSLPAPTALRRDLTRGEYTSILHLLEVVDKAVVPSAAHAGARDPRDRRGQRMTLGASAKLLVDRCAASCAHTQHLVAAVAKCSRLAEAAEADPAQGPTRAAFWRHRALKYLERYAVVLLFAAYALLAAGDGFEVTFSEWTHRHWQFKRALRDLTVESSTAYSFIVKHEKDRRSLV